MRADEHFDALYDAIDTAVARRSSYFSISISEGLRETRQRAREVHDAGNTVLFIGNGGSAAIASHMAIDFCKAAGWRARCFNDAAALTCLANDCGYESVFAAQLASQARAGDLLIAISSSGKSPNIIEAVRVARKEDCSVITFSGFAPDNPLRPLGDLNFYVNSQSYGIVEVAHLALLHAVLDLKV